MGAVLGGEVISADSVQVYRRFDIGSGKPSPEERALCPHHLIDVCDAHDPIDASRFAGLADAAIADVAARGKVPIVCGGTFLWVRALLRGLASAPAGDDELRREHLALAEQEGRPAVHARLAEVDPKSAARLHPNDFVRVSRALEVYQLTGKKLSELQAAHGFRQDRYAATLVGIDWPRDLYAERVRARVASMLSAGFIEEVRELVADGYAETRPMDSVGYRQVRVALASGELDYANLTDEIARVTRIFARRQRTWLRDRDIRWLEPNVLSMSTDQLATELGRLGPLGGLGQSDSEASSS
jgi:tRNA dimethylallyltransferase